MKLVMTLLVRDEVDVIESQIAFHRAAGVDFFVVTDHDSSDGTREILQHYADVGVLHLLTETSPTYHQSTWVTRMARMAALEFGADWVVNSDADEFWWPSGGNLKEVLERVPERIGRVGSFVRPFVPPVADGFFAEEMTMRLSLQSAINDPTTPFRANVRILHRAVPDVVVGTGNATVRSELMRPGGAWSPVEVLHFPIRSYAHFERKFLAHHETVRDRRRGDHSRAWDAARTGRLHEVYAQMGIDESEVDEGIAAGWLQLDTRLRDALRRLELDPNAALEFSRRKVATDARLAVERTALRETELVRMQRRVDRLAERLSAAPVDAGRSPSRPRKTRRLARGADVVMTLVVRDEAEILDAQLSYHLDAGVDFVIATDHRSEDGTREILESYARAGALHLIRENGQYTRQSAWQTRMARMAANEYRAKWVINSDADEFWWPRGVSIKEALTRVPPRFGVIQAHVRNFVPLRAGGGAFSERMTVRLAVSAPINDPATPFRPVVKVAHRGHPAVVVAEGGSHQVFGMPWATLDSWSPLEILHFPLRSRKQCERKYRKTWTGWERNFRADLARARQSSLERDRTGIWERVALAEAEVERGLGEGWLVSDTRLRDTLRTIPGGAPSALATEVHLVAPPTRAELDANALETAVFEEAELVRYTRWANELASRVESLKHA
jgi:Glycosyl transferase family 2